MPLSKSSKKQKVLSYWELMDSVEKFTVVFIVATLGFLTYMMVM